MAQSKLYQEDVNAGLQREQQQREFNTTQDYRNRQLASEEEYRKAQLEQGKFAAGAGGEIYNTRTGEVTHPGITAAQSPDHREVVRNGKKYIEYFDKMNPARVISTVEAGPAQEPARPGSMQPVVDANGNITAMVDTETGVISPANYGPGVQGPVRRTPIAPGVMKDERDLANSVEKIRQLGTLYNPSFVGPAEGRMLSLKSKLPFTEMPPGWADFDALGADLQNQVIKLITGAQMGQQEAQRILRQVPTSSDKPAMWESKYKMTLANAERLYNMIQNQTGITPNMNPPGGTPQRPTANPNAKSDPLGIR